MDDYDALLLPGGHRARGMRQYLESPELQRIVLDFFLKKKPVAAICHGVLLAARTIDPATGRSVLYGRRTTALTWALERSGMIAGRIGRFWDPNYYRTYLEKPGQPTGYMSVQQEVTRSLAKESDFLDVPAGSSQFRVKTSGTVVTLPMTLPRLLWFAMAIIYRPAGRGTFSLSPGPSLRCSMRNESKKGQLRGA